MDYIGQGWGMGIGMWFTLILLILIVVYVLKELTKDQEKNTLAQNILDKRYANGEIDTKEYEEISNALKKNNEG